jgi:hypothetical protein
VQKTLEFPRIAAIATSAVVVAGAFAITPVTTNTAAPRSVTADVALASCGLGYDPWRYCFNESVAQAYSNLVYPFTQEAVDWLANPALNGTWTVAEAAPGDEDAYALQQLANGSWGLFAPTGDEDEELVKLVAAAEEEGWTLQHPSGSDSVPPTWIVNPPGDLIAGGSGGTLPVAVAGVGAVTAAIATPFPILRQIANNQAYYAGLLSTMPLEAAVAEIVATVAAHAQAVGLAAEGLIPLAIDGEIKRNQAILGAVQKAVGYFAEELTTNFGSGKAVEAFRAGFLSPRGYDGTVASSIPGTFLAGATGPGIIANPADCTDTCYVASVVVQNQRARARFVNAMGGVNGQHVPGCSSSTGSCEPPAVNRAWALAHPQSAAARPAAATTAAAIDNVADTVSSSTDTVQKPAGKHRATRSAASRATAS